MREKPYRLEKKIGELLLKKGWTLSVAECCIGGLLGHRITQVAGASRYFKGGVITYWNEVKEEVLGVPPKTLIQYGAVSKETALAMARGVRRLLNSDVAISVTGIAGPGGGTPKKPVGTVFIALVAEDKEIWEKHRWKGDRWSNKEQSATAGLKLLEKFLN